MINYKVSKCRNPKNPDTDYFKGTTVKSGEYTFDDLANDINNSTTVTKADAMAVLASIKPYITKALLAGQVVILQDIGHFQVSLQGKCYNAETLADKEFKPADMIRSHRIVFRPDKELKKELKDNVVLRRISSEHMK